MSTVRPACPMRHSLLCVVGLVVLGLLLPCATHAQNAGGLLQQGKDLLNRKDYRKAEEILSERLPGLVQVSGAGERPEAPAGPGPGERPVQPV